MASNAESWRTLAALLAVEYVIDPGEVEFLAEELGRLPPDEAARAICQALRNTSVDQPVLRQNIEAVVGRSGKAARKAMEKAAKNKSIPVGAHRTWLRSILRPAPAPAPATSVPAKKAGAAAAVTPGFKVLDLQDKTWTITELPALVDRIAQCNAEPGSVVTVHLGPFTCASALAVLACWAVNRGLDLQTEAPREMRDYLDRMRFAEALHDPVINVSPDYRDWAVGLTRINRDLPSDKVARKIVDIIDTFVQPAPETRNSIEILMSEMIENVHRHAEISSDGFIAAQTYPKKLKLGITLVDCGLGIRETFVRGDPKGLPPNKLQEARNDDLEALRQACEYGVTSKGTEHSGYGLYILSRLTAINRGTFLLCSGKATLIGYQSRAGLTFDGRTHGAWQGTIISIALDLHRKLPIREVYRNMPAPPEGYAVEDFFDV